MCGISGLVSTSAVTQNIIQKMNDAIAHRGPDGEGVEVMGNVGLGHRRLSIIDIEGGFQPMANADGSVWITFNGEIYNYRELRRKLEPEYRFATKSDTEVVLHLYEKEGVHCLNKLRGMFAFAIYDCRNRKLFLARDHLGQKPLYYFDIDGDLGFASEIKALLAIKPALRELDEQALHEYLTLRIITPPRSMFRRVRKLPPGHYLVYQNGQRHIERYWDLRYQPKIKEGFKEVCEELDRQISEAVQYNLVSDVRVGAFLSGGMDSSLIVAMMSHYSDGPIATFSGEVPYENYSELPYARTVVDRYRCDGHEITISPSLVKTLPELVWHLDEPSDPLSVCMYYIAKLARAHVKVVLGGDGGDELFGGYDRYFGNRYVSYYALLPAFLRKRLFEHMLRLVPEGFWYRSASHKLKWMHQMSFFDAGLRYAKSLGYFYFSDRYRDELYAPKLQRAARLFDPEAAIEAYFDSTNAQELIDKMLYADSMTRMPDHPVMISDRMTMAHGLEARSPFMDHKLTEFCARIPPQYKVRRHRLRYIQTQIAKRHLPSALITRKKQGFSSPLTYLLADEFKILYKAFLNRSRLVEDGYFEPKAIENMLAEHINGKADHGQRLWQLCNSEVWYRMYIDGQASEDIRAVLQQSECRPGQRNEQPKARPAHALN
ncbi:MAG: asparagine synthase (glutamine-hydrolyzing) [Gammaproteobacteria bacterium]|nr:asparagine synthase (glutamine-hydrolyzing) [Gammaproteobacteria bacterium]